MINKQQVNDKNQDKLVIYDPPQLPFSSRIKFYKSIYKLLEDEMEKVIKKKQC